MALITCKDCKKEFSTDAKNCPNCGAKKPRKTLGTLFSWAVLTIAVIWGFDEIANNSSTNIAGQPVISQANNIHLPLRESKLIAAVQNYQVQASSAPNDMVLGGLRYQRKQAICQALGESVAKRWVGKIKELSSNSDGKGVLYITLADNITVGTINNDLSDSLLPARTLIEQDSDVFRTASTMKVGDYIIFSGFFLPGDKDCILEESMTLSGAMKEPEFLFKFAMVWKP